MRIYSNQDSHPDPHSVEDEVIISSVDDHLLSELMLLPSKYF
jgi:hypothetical protein